MWPFDSWLGWGGLRGGRLCAEAERVRVGVLAALDTLGQRARALRGDDAGVALIPTSNAVQAWSIGARWALENEWDGMNG